MAENKFKVGKTYHINQYAETYLIHVLCIVDERQVVFKYYGKHKKRWFYEVEDFEILQIRVERAEKSK